METQDPPAVLDKIDPSDLDALIGDLAKATTRSRLDDDEPLVNLLAEYATLRVAVGEAPKGTRLALRYEGRSPKDDAVIYRAHPVEGPGPDLRVCRGDLCDLEVGLARNRLAQTYCVQLWMREATAIGALSGSSETALVDTLLSVAQSHSP